jgi:hypothetical protein
MRYILLLLLVLFSSFVYADVVKVGEIIQNPKEYVKVNSFTELSVYCLDGNNACSHTTTCTINIIYNNNFLIKEQNMSNINNNYLYNYTFSSNGIYTIEYICSDGHKAFSSKFIEVNPLGADTTNTAKWGFNIIIFHSLSILFFIYLVFISVNSYLKFGGLVLAGLQFVLMLFSVYVLYTNNSYSGLLLINFWLFSIIMFGLFIYKGIVVMIDLLDIRNKPKSEDFDKW